MLLSGQPRLKFGEEGKILTQALTPPRPTHGLKIGAVGVLVARGQPREVRFWGAKERLALWFPVWPGLCPTLYPAVSELTGGGREPLPGWDTSGVGLFQVFRGAH